MSTTPGDPGPDDGPHRADPPDPFGPGPMPAPPQYPGSQPELSPEFYPAPSGLPRDPRRFDGGAVLGGSLLGLVLPFVSTLILGNLLYAGGQNVPGWVGVAIVVVALLLPTVLGAILASRRGSPGRRGFWLGTSIGSATMLVVGGGICIAILRSYP